MDLIPLHLGGSGSTSWNHEADPVWIRIPGSTYKIYQRYKNIILFKKINHLFVIYTNNKLITNKQKWQFKFFRPDPDPLFHKADPQIRIQIKIKWTLNTAMLDQNCFILPWNIILCDHYPSQVLLHRTVRRFGTRGQPHQVPSVHPNQILRKDTFFY